MNTLKVSKRDKKKHTVSPVDMEEILKNLFLDPDDVLLSMDSLKEDSLLDTEMQSLRGVWDKKCRHGTFSARVSLYSHTQTQQTGPQQSTKT